ncbi:MAG: hypothetical protein HC876_13810 [Chloroflexaceae bacterium]|nr:hypothetical protein [Chloroflexaceae bacterium]
MDTARLQERFEELKQRPNADRTLINAMHTWIVQSNLPHRYRINPAYLADELQVDISPLLTELLYGVPVGLFNLHWDVHCPHCYGITNEFQRLADAQATSRCPACKVDFALDFAERVEVTFSLNPEIEQAEPPLEFFAPIAEFHPRFGIEAWTGERVSAEEAMEPGLYRYMSPITLAKGLLYVEGTPTTTLQEHVISERGGTFEPDTLTVQPGPLKITLVNEMAPRTMLWATPEALPCCPMIICRRV